MPFRIDVLDVKQLSVIMRVSATCHAGVKGSHRIQPCQAA
jgi:hypothetical protein